MIFIMVATSALTTRRPRHHHGALTASQSSAALDVCVASSIAAAARGDAAQAAFDRKLSQYRNEIGELRQQNIHYAQFSRIFQREQSGSSQASVTESCTTGDMSQPSTAGLGCTTLTSTVPTLTQHFQTTVTS